MTQTISVYYEPLKPALGIQYYHKTLVYTTDNGSVYKTSGPSLQVDNPSVSQVVAASASATSNTSSPFGTLSAPPPDTLTFSNAKGLVTSDPFDPAATYQHTVVSTGDNLSAQWNAITTAAAQISSQNLPYSALTQNSNSLASSALTAAGLTPPSDNGVFSDHWAPASGNILPTSNTSASNDNSTTCSADAQGQMMIQVNDRNSSGNVDGSITGLYDASGNLTNDSISGSDITAILSDISATVNISGINNTLSVSGTTINLANGASTNIVGSDDVVDLGASASIGLFGGGDTINNDVSGNSVNFATNSSATINGSGGYFGVCGTNVYVEASGERSDTLSGATYNLTGNNDTLTLGANSYVGLLAGSSGNTVINDVAGETVNVYSNTSTDIEGSGGYFGVVGTNAYVIASGESSNTIDGASYNLTGNDDTLSLGANSYVGLLGGSGNTVNGSNDTVGTLNNTSFNENGSNDVNYLGAGDVLGAYGGDNTIYAGAGDEVVVGNTNGNFDSIVANGDQFLAGTGDGIYLDSNAQANVSGSSDGISLATGDSLGAYGGGSTIYGGGADLVYITNTQGNADTVDANGDQLGGLTANGQGTGIILNANTQANVYGSQDGVDITGSGASLGMSGSSDTVDASGANDIFVSSTNGEGDILNVSDDTSGGTTANGQPTGISLGNDAQAQVFGSGDNIGLGSGDTLAANSETVDLANSDTADAIVGNSNNIYETNDAFDIVGNYDTNWTTHSQAEVIGSNDPTDGSYDIVHSSGSGDNGSGYDDSFADDGEDGYDEDYYGDYGFVGTGKNNGSAINGVGIVDRAMGFADAADAADIGYANAMESREGVLATSADTLFLDQPEPTWSTKTITWSFTAGPTDGADPFSGAITQSDSQSAVESAFQTWSAASGINFEQVASTTPSDLVLGWGDFDTADTGQVGYTAYRAQNGIIAPGAKILLEDPSQTAITDSVTGSPGYAGTDVSVYQTALHEIGHALGLGDNSDQSSIMYYSLGSNNTGLDSTDLAAISLLYGESGGIETNVNSVAQPTTTDILTAGATTHSSAH